MRLIFSNKSVWITAPWNIHTNLALKGFLDLILYLIHTFFALFSLSLFSFQKHFSSLVLLLDRSMAPKQPFQILVNGLEGKTTIINIHEVSVKISFEFITKLSTAALLSEHSHRHVNNEITTVEKNFIALFLETWCKMDISLFNQEYTSLDWSWSSIFLLFI